ncbi:efflux RND transporter periplasmic adaptor subunit [Desulfopila sp. IMCC35008]|uniref:efflux RND transporter periplasmic adaptor subunit n=1 Tax=Desulfopila sp. IMCC35008 TaxID=2653858 RepID=UPI0013D81615|nr:efflux RND transporter periplasmic adaptor subunit [Desulfopila sp. IMCC35008]
MNYKPSPDQQKEHRLLFFFWNNLPRFVLLLMILLILALVAIIQKESELIAANKASAISTEKPPVNVVTLELVPGVITDRLNLPGSIEPWTDLTLLAKISGTIEEVFIQEGDRVQKGDVIARIEEADYRIAIDRAKAAYNLAKADFDRDKSIYTKGMIPTADLESRKTGMQTAKADLEKAELQYSRCKITAPMDGVIERLDAKVGLQLSVGDPIARILEIDRLKGVIGIPESDVSAIRTLDAVDITIQALDDMMLTAKKHFLSPAPGSIARLYDLELEIDNLSGKIMPGMFIRADIVKRTVKDAIAIPFYSVISRNNEQFVFIEKDGIAEKRDISLGIMEQWMVEIPEGLKEGERLIVEGHRDIESGQQVRVVKAAKAPEELML